MEKNKSLSLYQLNEYIRQVMVLNFRQPLWVSCEISQVGQSKGHFYLDLVEKSRETSQILAQINAVLWRKQALKLNQHLPFPLEKILQDGIEVLLKVEVEYHERYGLKLVVLDIDSQYTFGQLALAREATLARLKEEKLISLNHQLSMPSVLHRIAVISSSRAAGLADFLRQLSQNEFGYTFDCKLFEAAMQGTNAPREVSKALATIATQIQDFDVVIIIRGGGAKLDLAAFDDYEIAASIAKCVLPVLTGIGHEIDTSIADIVAHTPLKTPTAVAEFLINNNRKFEATLDECWAILEHRVKDVFYSESIKLKQAILQVQQNAQKLIDKSTLEMDNAIPSISIMSQHLINQNKQEMLGFEKICKLVDIESTLKRGFAILIQEGNAIMARDYDDKLPLEIRTDKDRFIIKNKNND